MSYKRKLVEFTLLKSEFIEKETGIEYTNIEDLKDLRRWSNTECREVYKTLHKEIINYSACDLYENTCPWCILGKMRNGICNLKACGACGYGKRHGVCGETNSLYNICVDHNVRVKLTNEMYKKMISQVEK